MPLKIEKIVTNYWRMKYRINGKEKSLSFGVYPGIAIGHTVKK